MPRVKIAAKRLDQIYAGSKQGIKIYAGSNWKWTIHADFDVASISYSGQDQTLGRGFPVANGSISYGAQDISVGGTYQIVDKGSITYTGMIVQQPVWNVSAPSITYTAQNVNWAQAAFSDAFSDAFTN